MNELSQKLEVILSHLESSKKKVTFESLKKELNIKGEEQTNVFERALNTLVENGSLFFNSKTKEYETLKNKSDIVCAELQFRKNGNAFIKINNTHIAIDNSNLNGAFEGDRVLVHDICTPCDKHSKKLYGKVYKILKRKSDKVVFEVVGDGLNASLIPPIGFNTFVNVRLSKNDMMKLQNGQYIVVSVGTEKEFGEYPGELIEIIKESREVKPLTQLVAKRLNVETEFSEAALEEARRVPTEVTDEDLLGRVDLRNKKFFTIDCDNTKDRDDAICVEKLENGNYKLYTSISHVSYYVKRGTQLFYEAVKRCVSHYPNDDCIPMLPSELSNGICSLNENVDRLVRVFEIEISPNGQIVDSSIYKGVIRSQKEMRYSDVNKLLAGEQVEELDKFKEDLELINELNLILQSKKEERDCLDFDTEETEFVRDSNDSILDIKSNKRGVSEKIIENFMVLTNTVTSTHFSWAPIIYRIHPEPEIENVKHVLDMIWAAGCEYNRDLVLNEQNSRKIIKSALEGLKHMVNGNFFKDPLIRSMKRAEYNTENCGHYALNLNSYSHTTSPIRRLADLILHTIIDEIEEGTFDYNNYEQYITELNNYCYSINQAEKLDFDMEKLAEAVNFAEYASKHIGEEFEARVTEFNNSSLFVTTSNHIRGILDFKDMEGCKCHYDPKRECIVDVCNKRSYKIGNDVPVIIKNTDKMEGIVHFEMPKRKVLRLNNR